MMTDNEDGDGDEDDNTMATMTVMIKFKPLAPQQAEGLHRPCTFADPS